MNQKICKKCGETKSFINFIKNKLCKNGIAGTCKKCSNIRSKMWKRKNSERLSLIRRQHYAETEGAEAKERERKRRESHPLRVRCQTLRKGMCLRAKMKKIPFDSNLITVDYLMNRIEAYPKCECCHINLRIEGDKNTRQKCDTSPSIDRIKPEDGYVLSNIAILCWRCNNLKRNATPQELQTVVDWMWRVWKYKT